MYEDSKYEIFITYYLICPLNNLQVSWYESLQKNIIEKIIRWHFWRRKSLGSMSPYTKCYDSNTLKMIKIYIITIHLEGESYF
jgi:hypothetical protein